MKGTWLFWASRKKSDVKGEQKEGHCILETGPFLNDLYFLVPIMTTKKITMLKTPSKDYLCASTCLHQSSINPTSSVNQKIQTLKGTVSVWSITTRPRDRRIDQGLLCLRWRLEAGELFGETGTHSLGGLKLSEELVVVSSQGVFIRGAHPEYWNFNLEIRCNSNLRVFFSMTWRNVLLYHNAEKYS